MHQRVSSVKYGPFSQVLLIVLREYLDYFIGLLYNDYKLNDKVQIINIELGDFLDEYQVFVKRAMACKFGMSFEIKTELNCL